VTSVLALRRVSAGYGPLRVLSEIDLNVDEGERVGFVGLNGHGKSTLLRSIVGLVDWRSGEIAYRGRSILKWPTHRLARAGITLIPQGDALFPGLTLEENLDAGAFASSSWRGRKARREYILEVFPALRPRLRQIAGTLSGGERRMLSVGRGLMSDADVYLIDEPSLGLAPAIGRSLLDILTGLDLGGRTLLLAEQNRALVEGRLDRVIRIHGGQIREEIASPPRAGPAAESSNDRTESSE
jgi:branched-chain amino acid transport system ATP-binding protein